MSASQSRTVRRLTVGTLLTGALVTAAAAPASADHDERSNRSHRSQVVISAVQYDSPGFDDGSNRSLNREWVDITNTGRSSVSLRDWTLSGRDGHTYTFRSLWLEGRSTVRVHTGIGRDTSHDVYQDRRFYVWDNHSDTATLRNDHGGIVDSASWGRGGLHHDRIVDSIGHDGHHHDHDRGHH